jgi:hypothetical protein
MFDQKASAVTNRKITAKEATSSRRLINMTVVPSDRLQIVTAWSRQWNCIRHANLLWFEIKMLMKVKESIYRDGAEVFRLTRQTFPSVFTHMTHRAQGLS